MRNFSFGENLQDPYSNIMFFLAGIIILGLGAELTINCSIKTAWKLGLSPLIIGLTLVSIGTSIPEISISVAGGFDRFGGFETSGIVVGNWIGSVLNQMTIILGIVGLFGTMKIPKRIIRSEGLALLSALVLFFLIILDGNVSRLEGLILILSYIAYLSHIILYRRKSENLDFPILEDKVKEFKICKMEQPTYKDVILLVTGIAFVAIGSDTVIKGGIELSRFMNIDQSAIGFIFVGLGTGIPELIVSLRAIMKGDISISVGNLLGSNMAAILLSADLGSIIAGFAIDNKIIHVDTPITILLVLLTLIILRTRKKLGKKESLFLIVIYFFLAIFILTI